MDNNANKRKKPRTEIPITLQPDWNVYWNPNRYMGLKDYWLFMLTGGRGIGKTTGCDWFSANDWNKRKYEFVICRRYQTELSKIRTAFDGIAQGITTQGLGKGGFMYMFDGQRIGYGLSLANQSAFKSGVDFSKVHLLIYDEAILIPHGNLRYLKDEITQLLELISTIFRSRTDYRVFILGNNLDVANPYFEYFRIPLFKDTYKDPKRGIYCEMIKDKKAFIEMQERTPLAKLTKGTSYYDYHYGNEVLVPNITATGKKEEKDILQGRLVVNGKTINLYYRKNGLYAEMRDKIIEDDMTMKILDKGQPNWFFVKLLRTSDFGRYLQACWYQGKIVCDTPSCGLLLREAMEVLR